MNDQTNRQQHLAECKPRKGLSGMLRSLAGATAGWTRSRRGSFLVIAVGTLALLAVMALIYSSIGTHDARMVSSSQKQEKLDEVPQQFADYIARLIGESTLVTYFEINPGAPGAPVPLMRMTSDYPSTSYDLRSDATRTARGSLNVPFNPTGGVAGFITTPDYSIAPPNLMPDAWRPSTPWLASTEPTYLNFAGAAPTDPNRPYLDFHDWRHISNISPDGRFVNLFNLRNNWGAQSGFNNNTAPYTMSDNLSLYDNQGRPQSGNSLTDWGIPVADYNVPAYLDSRQQWLFRPARATPGILPSDRRYDTYQFADADGDGMFDSRWQELADSRAAFLSNILKTDGKIRYFFATRIVDLSGLVNVNTAGDMHAAPIANTPAGSSVAEIDLQRLLRMHDVYTAANGGYDFIWQPTSVPNTPSNYGPLGSDPGGYNALRSQIVGDFGYTSLRLALAGGVIPPAGYRSDALLNGPGATFASDYSVPNADVGFTTAPYLGFADPVRRTWYAMNRALTFEDTVFTMGGGGNPNTSNFTGAFGLSDLYELSVRRAVNDDDFTSALETTLDGRNYDASINGYPDATRFGILRSNRPLDVERNQRYTFPINPAAGGPYDKTMLQFYVDGRQRLTPISGGRDFRSLPIVARTGQNGLIAGVSSDELDSAELRIDPRPILSKIKTDETNLAGQPLSQQFLRQRALDLQPLFQAYADALLPTSGVGDPWAAAATTRLTEFYGGKGPEMALHAAAHMAANFIDMYDLGGVPTVQTLLMSNTSANFVNSHSTGAAPAFPNWVRSTSPLVPTNGFELPGYRLGDAAADAIQTPALNIYGVEAQPFLTQVASYTVYADATESGGGDNEQSTPSLNITIKGDIDFANNHDLMYRVVAFQLTNPFGVDVKLGNVDPRYGYFDVTAPNYPAPGREANFYYIKFGDKIFKLAALDEATYVDTATANTDHAQNPPIPAIGNDSYAPYSVYIQNGATDKLIHLSNITIPAGKSVVCYALSDVPHRILKDRFGHLTAQTSDTAAYYFQATDPTLGIAPMEVRTLIKNAIEKELGRGTTDIGGITSPGLADGFNGASGVYWIPELDPTTQQVKLPHDDKLFPAAGTVKDVSLWRTMRYGAEAQNQPLALPTTYWDGTATPPNPPGGAGPTAPPLNDFTNDQLVDRMRVYGTDDLDRHLPAGQNEVAGTGNPGNGNSDHPEFLYMMTTHATLRRKADPRPGNAKPPLGAIPGYCLEPKFETSWNVFEKDDLLPLDDAQFTSTPNNYKGASKTPKNWMRDMGAHHLDHYATSGTPKYQMWQAPGEMDEAAGSPYQIGTTDPNGTGTPVTYDKVYPVISIADNEFTQPGGNTLPNGTNLSTLRIGDMLLPLGIGPEEMPFDKAGNAVTDLDLRWTTLGEALSLALGYQHNAPPNPTNKPDATYPYWYDTTVAGAKSPLDRGNLRLDAYVPYTDLNSNNAYDANEPRQGLEIPLALNVLDTFTISPADVRNTGVVHYVTQTLTSPARGKLNINTAPEPVLRTVDMLNPPPSKDLSNQPWWWWQSGGAGTLPPLNGDPAVAGQPTATDIVAGLVAFRDKATVQLRRDSVFTSPGGTLVDSMPFSEVGPTPDADEGQLNGRGVTSNIGVFGPPAGPFTSALHERPGFNSVAELALVRYRDPGDATSNAWPCNIDWLAHDNYTLPAVNGAPTPVAGNSGREGLDSVLYKNPQGASPATVPDQVPNDYKEQLEILNGVIGNVSTRSDYFVVWFQVQGYKESDVTNLGDNDPMIPSVNRRFMMVVDRSKVTKRGQKADILLFKEVPVDPEPR